MKVPMSWLREYCDPGIPAEEIADLLSMRAVEVERVSTVGPPSSDGFVVGYVVSAEQHPNADRLSVCVVNDGEGERTIVCGAPNVATGQTVAVALPGAVMPGGQKLGKAKLRGIESAGMILAEDELQLGSDHDGIMVLATGDGAPAPGTSLAEVLPIAEEVLELDLNPNRSDCLGLYGVAREVHAITGADLAPPPWAEDYPATGSGSVKDLAKITVEVPELCPRFTARAFEGVQMGQSPLWLRARLIAAGQRPISNIVDITNYVMLLTGQPLHSYDLDQVAGGILVVRAAADGEKITTLDGNERVLDPEMVLICDEAGPSGGIAGVMGGRDSEVSGSTTRVLLEAATWNGPNILRTSNELGLRSEASTRFEKQLHPELGMRAQRVASRLICENSGASLVPGTIDEATEPPAPHVISLRSERIEAILGIPIDTAEAQENLTRLGFGVEREGDDLRAEITPERHYDVTREIDLIEEVARLHGIDQLPRTLPAHGQRGGLTRGQTLRRRLEDSLRDMGFDQAISWGLIAPAVFDLLRLGADDVRRTAVRVSNPLSEGLSVMRTTLLSGLLDAARRNLAHGMDRADLFESGRAYFAEPPPAGGLTEAGAFPGDMPAPDREPHRLAAITVGPLSPPAWRGDAPAEDFFVLKGVIEVLARGVGADPKFAPGSEPFLHPARAASVSFGGVHAGWLGELHPAVAAEWDLPSGVAFEFDVAPLLDAAGSGDEVYEDLLTHPALLQDLAVVVPEDVPAERVRETVLSAGGELLRSAEIFDLYRGDQVGEGKKSLALRLEFRAQERTLTDEEVAPVRSAINDSLEGIGGSLRG
ncbi:MAG: phenylalanyl-tRNA synthetase beta chain [Solirubrobacterales bacterium]|jgi:phenylalanyl-tRNA synthetase beta chain|nr:phenylalanyl-tRNA synthetase beta chain [Solirubrobacterales bacterium]